MRRIHGFYLAAVVLIATCCQARDLAVVVNKNNPVSAVSAAELEKLLKTVAPSWPDGKRVKIFLTDPAADDNRTILPRLCKMTPTEIKNLAEAHRVDIQIVASDELVLSMVENNPGALGIVNVYAINSRVKVLKVDDKLPLEQGYLLHGN
jgi:hypothetical protein